VRDAFFLEDAVWQQRTVARALAVLDQAIAGMARDA
jgi:hypothetical protein